MKHVCQNGRLVLSGCLIINEQKEILLLYRKKHNHYETPGGKVDLEDCENPCIVQSNDLITTAKRELFEEIGDDVEIEDLKYFGEIEFIIPDGRKAISHKFVTKIINGEPRINEPELFSKLDYLPIRYLENYPISPDLKRFVSELQKFVGF